MPFWRLYYHTVWATKHRAAAIDDGMIEPIQQAIRRTSIDLNVIVLAVGVMPDHIHVLAQIPPSLAVATVVGRLKGASSHAANEHRPDALTKVAWQAGYGILSVSQSGVKAATSYVENQRHRHAIKDLYGPLERTDDEPS